MKIIYKSFCPFPHNLGAFAPWREEFPTPSTFDARLFAHAAQIFNYSNTQDTEILDNSNSELRVLRVLRGAEFRGA